jgi:thiol:disulfide interchange protein
MFPSLVCRLALLCLATFTLPGCLQSSSADSVLTTSTYSVTKLTPAGGELTAQLQSLAARAKHENLKPFVQFTAVWCGPCRELQACMDDPLMAEAFAKTFIIQINADDFSDKQFAAAGFTLDGIPAFFELDEQGKPTGRVVDGGAWEDNIPANMAPVLRKFFNNEQS